MNSQRQGMDLGFTKEQFPESGHICLIYDSEDQRKKIVSEYLAAGIRHGEVVRYIADVTTAEQVHAWLLDMGVELPERGPFSVLKAVDFYCGKGRFDPQELIDGMVARYEQYRAAGFSGVRSTGEMSWALKGVPGSDRWLEYEALLNSVPNTYPHSGMCQYDARAFDGATLFKVLRIHPYMVAQGQIVRNPFFMTPEEFRTELAHS